jgi:EAL domain-containing protein (putative c-di-GMP-specific phosphodiesterase class I)/GGDEF domain-containing protein
MVPRGDEVVLVLSPRYANDVAMTVQAAGMVPRVERLAVQAVARSQADNIRIAVVDARGAFEQGLAIARAIGPAMAAQKGGLLVLLSRSNAGDADAARAAGATRVLVSPFNNDAFGNALHLTARLADLLNTPADGQTPVGRLPHTDPLTGLATGDQLQQWLTLHQTLAPAMMVMILGVGRIGAMNAAYGRSVADEALRGVAARLAGQISDHLARAPQQWLLARLAAAEFGIALAGDIDGELTDGLSRLLVSTFATPFLVGGREIHLTARIGIVTVASDQLESAELLIRQGSAALATSRAGEPGAVTVFSPETQGDALLRLADLVTDLHRAIENEEISLLFQPVLDFASGRISGVEALVRWDHRSFGQLDAETLLETAAAAELAVQLGHHIRARAMREVMSWPAELAPLRLSLNVTAADLADAGFVGALETALAASELPRERLTLEITEGALIDNIAGAALVLENLRCTGIGIVLDDFGTGFSSLAWLARLPIDGIKLDRSFTQALGGTERERIVVETVVLLARRLGLDVVAEGVEEPLQLAAAFAAGCNAVQGFEIAVPLSSRSLIEFCAAWVVLPGGKSR